MFRFVWLGCFGLLANLAVLWHVGSVWAAPSVQRLHAAWEESMGNQMIQSYYCVGLVGDLYRGGVYNAAKTQRIVTLLNSLLSKQKQFVKTLRIGSDRNQKALYRHIHSTLDLLVLAVQSLQKKLSGEPGELVQQFLQYRNAAAQDLQKLLQHRGLQRRRYYVGGYNKALQHFNHHLGLNLAYSYLTIGLIADGYFQLILNTTQAEEYLGTNLRLIQSGQQSLLELQSSFRGADRAAFQPILSGMQAVFNQATILGQFLKTRQRPQLRRYQQLRQQAWQYVQALATP